MEVITTYDYILFPFYLLFFYAIVLKKAQQFNGTEIKKFFITGFFLKMGGALLYAMVVQYYYGYGDSFIYFDGSNFIRKLMSEPQGLTSFFASPAEISTLATKYDVSSYTAGTMSNDANLAVIKISTLVSYLSFGYYLVITLFFGFFSFVGMWKLFLTFRDILGDRSSKWLAYVVLYTPSIWFWGSGLNKESLCMGSLGIAVSILYKMLVKKKFSLGSLLWLLGSFYLLYIVKSYIAGALLAALAASLITYYIMARNSFISKFITTLIVLIFGITVFSYTANTYMDTLLEDSASVIQTSKTVYAEEEEGSVGAFSAGEFDISIQGLLLGAPGAIFTTLYRPFLWETRKLMMLFSALESFVLLAASVFLLVKLRFFRFFSIIFSNPYLLFCFIFTLLMGAVIGLTTFNFGTLVRYRLPLLPFYGFLLIGVYFLGDVNRKKVIVTTAGNN